MPGPIPSLIFAAALLLVLTAATAPVQAEMTEADRTGMHTFAACLDVTGGDEEGCVRGLGRYAWYPSDEASCRTVATQVRTALADSGRPEHKDIFFNERCARLALPHDTEVALDPDTPELGREYSTCIAESDATESSCDERLGLHNFYPANDDICERNGWFLKLSFDSLLPVSWGELFKNERCHRFGLPFGKPEVPKPAIGPTLGDLSGIRAFTTCLDETDNDEDACIERLGRFSWYPRDEEICEAIGARVDKIVRLGGDPVWRDLFQNERCARLGMPHGAAGLASPPHDVTRMRFKDCRNRVVSPDCMDMIGRHERNIALSVNSCTPLTNHLTRTPDHAYRRWWDGWFENERCWRLGSNFFDTTTVSPRKTTGSP